MQFLTFLLSFCSGFVVPWTFRFHSDLTVVTIYDEDMGFITSTTTKSSGLAVIGPLNVASYSMTVSKTGFQNQSKLLEVKWFGQYQHLLFRLPPANTYAAFIEVYT